MRPSKRTSSRAPFAARPTVLARLGGPCLLAAAGLLAAPDEAHAYCRTRTCEFDKEDPCPLDTQTGCSTEGAFVFWDTACIPFAVQRDGSLAQGIAAEDVEPLIAEGFEEWSRAACAGGGSPELSASSQGRIVCDAVEYNCKLPESNSNLIMFRDDFVDTRFGLRLGVIALTTLTANLRSGELFDADIEINSRDEDFDVGNTSGLGSSDLRDLRGVINHELGHLLGLSHSLEAGALMRAGYEGTAVPAEDDVEGICAALGRSTTDPACEAAPLPSDAGCLMADIDCTSPRSVEQGGGCSCHVGAPVRPAALGWGVAVLIGCLACRRRGSRGASML